MIRELCEDAQVLQEWTQRLGVPYRGQRLAGASLEVFLHLLQRRRDNTSSRRAALLAEQDGMCKLCGAPITAANARFPIPVFCPLDCIVPAREGELADLTYVDLPFDGRRGLLDRLPYVGRGWCSKPACAEMLDSGLAQWRHFRWSLEATAHVDQRWLEQALQTMEDPGRKGRNTWPSSPSTRWWGSSPATWTSSIP